MGNLGKLGIIYLNQTKSNFFNKKSKNIEAIKKVRKVKKLMKLLKKTTNKKTLKNVICKLKIKRVDFHHSNVINPNLLAIARKSFAQISAISLMQLNCSFVAIK